MYSDVPCQINALYVPANFASAIVGGAAFSVVASFTVETNGDWAGKQWVGVILGLGPPRLADHISFGVTNVPIGFLSCSLN